MGGKGGGGDSGGGEQYATGNITNAPWNQGGASDEYSAATADQIAGDTAQSAMYKAQMEDNRKNYVNPTTGAWDETAWRANKGGSGFGWAANLFDRWYPEPKKEEPAAAAPAPAAPAPEPAAPAPVETPTTPAPDVLAPPAALGDALGGAVINPPRYWIGGIDSYTESNPTAGRDAGAITTTQT
jgi:hypothetical protein